MTPIDEMPKPLREPVGWTGRQRAVRLAGAFCCPDRFPVGIGNHRIRVSCHRMSNGKNDSTTPSIRPMGPSGEKSIEFGVEFEGVADALR